jgi:threonine dehydrogenase-like Zn-dependent dehydrogenase
MEAHGWSADALYDKLKVMTFMQTDRPKVIRQMIHSCRKGGTVSIIGAYGGFSDKIPTGALFNKGLTIKTGQCHVHRYVPELLDHIRTGRIDPSFVVTQRLPLSQAPEAYKLFRFHQEESIKIVLDPAA